MALQKQINTIEALSPKRNSKGEIIENVFIGIDTGVDTGFAVWSATNQKFIELVQTKIHRAMFKVLRYATSDKFQLLGVRVEDARKRSLDRSHPDYYKRLRASGSICRDAKVWEEFLEDYKEHFSYQMVAPQSNTTKTTPEFIFSKFGVNVKSEHIRDAMMLVGGFRNVPMLSEKEYKKQSKVIKNGKESKKKQREESEQCNKHIE